MQACNTSRMSVLTTQLLWLYKKQRKDDSKISKMLGELKAAGCQESGLRIPIGCREK